MVHRKSRKLQKISILVLVVAVDGGLLHVLPSFICAIAVDGGLLHVLPSFICTEWILPTILDVPTPLATPAYLGDEQESANGLWTLKEIVDWRHTSYRRGALVQAFLQFAHP